MSQNGQQIALLPGTGRGAGPQFGIDSRRQVGQREHTQRTHAALQSMGEPLDVRIADLWLVQVHLGQLRCHR